MDSFSTAFAKEVAKRITEAVARESEILEQGTAIASIDQYREHVGRLFAYRRVLAEYMPEAEYDLQNPKTGA